MQTTAALRGTALGILAALTASCTVTASTVPTGDVGNLQITWNVANSSDPSACTMYGADRILIHLYDATGATYGNAYFAPCASFATTVSALPVGTYGVSAAMVDVNGQQVSTTVGPTSIDVVSGQTSTETILFPATSFGGPPVAGNGTLIVTWDIGGQMDPAACTSHGVDSIHFRLTDSTGATVGGTDLMQVCNAFSSSTPTQYAAGAYTLSGELYSGSTVRTTTATTSVTIAAGGTLQVDLGFPETSFLPP